MPSKTNSILIVAAEASSSLYAQRLLELWRDKGFTVDAFGIGSDAMEELGFERIGKSEELAVVGFKEVLAHYPLIKASFNKIIEEVKKRRPQVILLLDYPDFNLRLAKKLKATGIPIVYFISPQVWAWRQSRVKNIKKLVDKMLVLFPFEEDFYKKHNVPVEFVGHPLLDELKDEHFQEETRNQLRSRYGLQPGDKVVGLMPGSRKSELKHHLAVQVETAEKIYQQHPTAKFALLVAPSFNQEELSEFLPDYKFPLMIVKSEPFEMISLVDVVLCASGTATLLVGLLEKPMVIMYKMNLLSARLAKYFVKNMKSFGMINLVLGHKAVPEFFQEEASPENLCLALSKYLTSPEYYDKTKSDLKLAKEKLGEKGAIERVASALEEYWS